VHPHNRATFNQRDWALTLITTPMACGPRSGRHRKVILVGEMRDRDTVKIAFF